MNIQQSVKKNLIILNEVCVVKVKMRFVLYIVLFIYVWLHGIQLDYKIIEMILMSFCSSNCDTTATHVKTRKLLQVCKQLLINLFTHKNVTKMTTQGCNNIVIS